MTAIPATASPGPLGARSTPATAGPDQAGRPFGPAGHHVGRGEFVGCAYDGGQQAGLGRSGDGEAEGGERRQQVDGHQRCAGADGDGHTGHRHRLEPIARAQYPARTAAIGKGTDERADHDAGNQLDEDHGHAGGRATVFVGNDEEDEPDAELAVLNSA